MAFQNVPNGIECVVHATQNGIPVVNVFHVKTPGLVSDADLTSVATIVLGWLRGSIFPAVNASYVLTDVTATDISTEGGHQVVLNGISTDHGADVLTQAAANAAVTISWRTSRIGRSYRGRTYIGGLSAVQLTDAQHLSSGVVSGFLAAAINLRDTLAAADYTLSVLSRYLNKALRIVGVLTEIVGIIVDTKVDSQRRRTAN